MESSQQFIKRKIQEFKRGKLISMKDIGRKGRHFFKRDAWTFMPQYRHPEKVFLIERLRKVEILGKISHPKSNAIGDIEYRIGYFMVGKNGRMNGRWLWGQFCPLIPQEDFDMLINKARKDNTILRTKRR